MSLSVTILCPNGRRKNVKVSPNATISQTLEGFCDRENLDSSAFSFLFQRKILDETLSWRYANIPNNAKLELIEMERKRTETPVRIALQYEVTHRVQDSFTPSATLWDILSHWKSDLSGLTPAGHEPAILYLRQEIRGREHLSATTLKSLGLTSGSAALRLCFKPISKNHNEKADVDLSRLKKKVPSKQIKEPAEGFLTEEMLQHALNTALGPDAGPKMDVPSTDTEIETDAFTLAPSTSNESMETAHSSQSSSISDFLETRTHDITQDGRILGASAGERGRMLENRTDHKNERVRARAPGSNGSIPEKKFKPTPPPSPHEDLIASFKFPEETRGMDLSSSPEARDDVDIGPLTTPCSRESIYYDENEIEGLEEGEDPGDEFFDLTVEDIQKMLSDLRAVQRESDEKMLVTARSRELERLRSISRYPKIVIRVMFPNRTVLQGIFRPAEPLQRLYEFVRKHLRDQRLNFYLYTTPPRVILKDLKSILYDNHLTPAAKVYFSLKGQAFHPKMIADEYAESKGTTLEANVSLQSVLDLRPSTEKVPRSDEIKKDVSTRPRRQANDESASTSRQDSSQSANASGARSKVPKWFKMGRK